ncbi:MAG: bifunctional oligoribonuclease/PAP phosphatase NrnA [Candidatus Gracilibacteria bacterium]|nr:bifunctional oligoribonuclease/PAP phosphatase NrnA [Candidatus Gracilibacteria bacterium]MDQ7023365.1 bifunctional oligoribonuclease/PAP phosphatase NrnA [Candidatus Gracilibacteria bacterium]
MLEKIKQLGEKIQKAEKIALFSHVRMDPDTFGSSTALYYILEKMGKRVVLLNDEKAPEDFSFLGANELISTNYNLSNFNPELIISLDAASIGQLAKSYENNKDIIKKLPFFVIDHHITNPGFGKINIIDINSSSTCELLFNILKENNLIKYIDKKIATLLMAGILTDTNTFYNTNVTPETHKVTAQLLELGADSRTGIFNFFKKKSLLKLQVLAKAITKIKIEKNKLENGKNIVYTSLSKKDLEELGATDKQTNGIIEYLINIENTEIAFIVYTLENGTNKCSFRSQNYNVSELAQKFDGGGHKQASGFSSEKDINEIIEQILENV